MAHDALKGRIYLDCLPAERLPRRDLSIFTGLCRLFGARRWYGVVGRFYYSFRLGDKYNAYTMYRCGASLAIHDGWLLSAFKSSNKRSSLRTSSTLNRCTRSIRIVIRGVDLARATATQSQRFSDSEPRGIFSTGIRNELRAVFTGLLLDSIGAHSRLSRCTG